MERTGKKIADYELEIWEVFLKYPRFITPKSFLGNRINLEIYTDACAKSPFEKEDICWDSGIGIGGILIINGKAVEFFSLEVNKRTFPWLEGLKGPHGMINFFELLSTYIGLRLWHPSRLKTRTYNG